MRDPHLRKTLTDQEFQRRAYRLLRPWLLFPLPGLLVGGATWLEFGVVSWAGVGLALLVFAAGILYAAEQVRRVTVRDLQREGVADADYRPPWLW